MAKMPSKKTPPVDRMKEDSDLAVYTRVQSHFSSADIKLHLSDGGRYLIDDMGWKHLDVALSALEGRMKDRIRHLKESIALSQATLEKDEQILVELQNYLSQR